MARIDGGRNSLGPRGFLTDEEKKNIPKVTKKLLLRILSYMKPYRLQVCFVFIAIVLSATIGLFPSIITGKSTVVNFVPRLYDVLEGSVKLRASMYEILILAIADLIVGYPDEKGAFIGWYVVDGMLQRNGIGSQIFADIRANLKTIGIEHIALGCVKENEIAVNFWKGLGFNSAADEKQVGKHTVVTYAREI